MPFIKRCYGETVSGSSAIAIFFAGGFDTIAAVDAYIKTFPGGANDVPYKSAGLYLQLPCDIEEVGPKQFSVKATYQPRGAEAVAPGGTEQTAQEHGNGDNNPVPPEVSWSSIGGTQHITQSRETIATKHRKQGEAARNFRRAIGVADDGSVAGVDVVRNIPRWSLKLELPGAAVTAAWVKKLEDLSSDVAVNSAPFFGYPAGELLFEGVQQLSNKGASGRWELQINFLVQRNRATVTLYEGPPGSNESIVFNNVEGWDYIWATYETLSETVAGKTYKITVPREAYLERVYRRADLNQLNLQKRRTP